MRSVSFARINSVDGKIVLEADDGVRLQLPLGLFVTLAIQARLLLPALEFGSPRMDVVPPIPIRAAAISVDIDATKDPTSVLLRLDPGAPFELPVMVPDTVASLLAHDLLQALQEKASGRPPTGRPQHS